MKFKNISPTLITEDRYDDRQDANQDAASDDLNTYMNKAIQNDFVPLYDILVDTLDLDEDNWAKFMSYGPEGADAEEYYVDKNDMEQFMGLVRTGNLKKAWGGIQSADEIKDERGGDYSSKMSDDDEYERDPSAYNGVS